MHYEGEVLVLTVERCPAIAHLKRREQLFTDRYCETTVVVNEAVCQQAGYRCSDRTSTWRMDGAVMSLVTLIDTRRAPCCW